MTTTYLAMSLLMPMQLKIFLSLLPNKLLLEYLSLTNVYNGNEPISKSVLIDLIVYDSYSAENVYTEKDNKLTIDEVSKLLSRNRDHVVTNN